MKRINRRIFLYSCLAIFCVGAPLLVLYAIGYRYDFEGNKIAKVGMVMVTDVPRGTEIILAGKKIGQGSELRIPSLTPRKYNLRLIKPGYQSWQKELAVRSKMVTWVSGVELFREEPSVEVFFDQPVSQCRYDENEKFFLCLNNSNDELWLIDPEKEKKALVVRAADLRSPENQEADLLLELPNEPWSKRGRQILIKSFVELEEEYWIVEPKENGRRQKIEPQEGQKIGEVVWDYQNEGELFWLADQNLGKIRKIKGAYQQMEAERRQVIALDQNEDELFTIALDDEKGMVLRIGDQGTYPLENEQIRQAEKVSIQGNFMGTVAILADGQLYLFIQEKNLTGRPGLEKIGDEVVEVIWADSKEEEKLLIRKKFEICFLEKLSDTKEEAERKSQEYDLNQVNPLNRLSHPIEAMAWYPTFGQAVYVANGEIWVIELDGRDRRNNFFLGGDGVSGLGFWLDKKGEKLFYAKIFEKNEKMVVLDVIGD